MHGRARKASLGPQLLMWLHLSANLNGTKRALDVRRRGAPGSKMTGRQDRAGQLPHKAARRCTHLTPGLSMRTNSSDIRMVAPYCFVAASRREAMLTWGLR